MKIQECFASSAKADCTFPRQRDIEVQHKLHRIMRDEQNQVWLDAMALKEPDRHQSSIGKEKKEPEDIVHVE